MLCQNRNPTEVVCLLDLEQERIWQNLLLISKACKLDLLFFVVY